MKAFLKEVDQYLEDYEMPQWELFKLLGRAHESRAGWRKFRNNLDHQNSWTRQLCDFFGMNWQQDRIVAPRDKDQKPHLLNQDLRNAIVAEMKRRHWSTYDLKRKLSEQYPERIDSRKIISILKILNKPNRTQLLKESQVMWLIRIAQELGIRIIIQSENESLADRSLQLEESLFSPTKSKWDCEWDPSWNYTWDKAGFRELGKFLEHLRIHLNLSKDNAASLVGTETSTLTDLEKGKISQKTHPALMRYLKLLKVKTTPIITRSSVLHAE